MLFKLSNLNSNLALTLGYLNPAFNNSALDQYNENLYKINHKHGKLILKTKIYILKYICLYIFRFILLFTSSLPFYNFLQVIGVVTGVGWVRNLRPKLDFWHLSILSISSFHYKMQQKSQLLSEQFSSPLLLAVPCEADGCSVCFSFLVEIQRCERSEVRDVGGARRLF